MIVNAIGELKNRIQLFCNTHDFLKHAADVAIDKIIQQNQQVIAQGKSPESGIKQLEELQELNELHEYEAEICAALQDALLVGLTHCQDLRFCNRLIQLIKLHRAEDFQSTVIECLVELTALETAVKKSPTNDNQVIVPQGMKDALRTFTNLPAEKQLDYKLQLFLEDKPTANCKDMMNHLGIGHDKLKELPAYRSRSAKESRSSIPLRDAEGVFD